MMHRAARVTILAVLVALATLGCSSESPSHASTSLVGDWLPCSIADCSEVADDGYRFFADGTVQRINGRDQAVSAAPICIELEESAGTYHFDGSTLDLEGMSFKAELARDILSVHDVPWGGSDGSGGVIPTAQLRRVSTYEGSPCPTDSPPSAT
jgi:hypothetical protein